MNINIANVGSRETDEIHTVPLLKNMFFLRGMHGIFAFGTPFISSLQNNMKYFKNTRRQISQLRYVNALKDKEKGWIV